MPAAEWSPLYLALRSSLIDRSGVLGFFHPSLGDAVSRRYLSDREAERLVRRSLADYFGRAAMSRRRVEERPWQLAAIEAWGELAEELADPRFLAAAWPDHLLQVRSDWAQVEARSPFRMESAYRASSTTPGRTR